MPSVQDTEKGSRSGLAKVRTGCITCKIRKVKCDEEKPQCVRCTSTGRTCDGYTIPPRKKRQTKNTNALDPSSIIAIQQTSSPSFEVFDDDDERRCFAFFKARTIDEISGYFPSDFWARLVPRATYHEPCLKHAVIALASLHERYEKGDRSILRSNEDVAEGGFALKQYTKAIQHLIKQSGKPSLDTFLVSCVLFACFESMRGHHGSALSHIQSGVQILSQANETGRTERNHDETLDPVFARLDAQKSQFEMVGARPMELLSSKKVFQSGFCQDIPQAFESLEEARNSLDYNCNTCQRKATDFEYRELVMQGTETQMHRDVWDAQRAYYQTVFKTWMNAYHTFLKINAPTMDSRALLGAKVLKINAVVATMHLNLSAFSIIHQQSCWDGLMPVYQELVELATAIIEGQKLLDQSLTLKPVFQLDYGIIPALFSVAHKCRDPYLRRQAITLLYSAPIQEGVWDSLLTARVCERIMNLEEKGIVEVRCAADIPDRARISDVNVTFDLLARRGHIIFSRLRSQESETRAPITDVLEW